MITINGIENLYTLDLNQHTESEQELTIYSYDEFGTQLTWSVVFSNGFDFEYHKESPDKLKIIIKGIEKFKKNAVLMLKNSSCETCTLNIIPNTAAIAPKAYTFKLGKISIQDNEISIYVNSRINNASQPWNVIYSGDPYNFKITTSQRKLNMACLEDSDLNFSSIIIIQQEKSEKKIKINVINEDGKLKTFEKTD